MSNDKKALIALMDLVLALADYATTPPGHRSKATERVQERATRLRALGEVVADGQAARTAVAATERRMRAWYGLEDCAPQGNPLDPHFGLEAYEGLEGDDRRITDAPRLMTAQEREAMEHATRELDAEVQAELDKRPSRRGHKCCGGKPDCGCARSVGG